MSTLSARLSYYAPPVLRVGLAAVVLWFGMTQILEPAGWLGYVPAWTEALGLAPQTVILLNGVMEIALGSLMMLGIFVRPIAAVLTVHMLVIVAEIGFSAVGVRDIGLAIALLAIAMHDDNEFSLT